MSKPWASRTVVRKVTVNGESYRLELGNYRVRLFRRYAMPDEAPLLDMMQSDFLDLARVMALSTKERRRLLSLVGKP